MKRLAMIALLTALHPVYAVDLSAVAEQVDALVEELFVQDASDTFDRGDYESARRKYEWLAARGSPTAQYQLGVIYEEGRVVVRDYGQAAQWYHRAAEQGHDSAQVRLGRLYYYGRGAPRDRALAYVWSHLASVQGNETGRRNRDYIASLLEAEHLAAAQKTAEAWLRRHNRD